MQRVQQRVQQTKQQRVHTKAKMMAKMMAKKIATKVSAMVVMLMIVGTAITSPTTAQSSGQQKGSLSVRYATASLDSVINYSARMNYAQATLEGFRVQIYSGSGVTSKDEAMLAQQKFITMYPNERVYVIYNAPFWRVRIGDYRSRSEALPMLVKLRGTFAGSYIVRDNTVRKKTFRE